MNPSQGKLLIVIGLPGSGKSYLISNMLRQEVTGICVHDFHGNAIDDSPEMMKSRHYVALVEALKVGHDCIIADIEFCRSVRREIAAHTLQSELPGLKIEYHCLRNQPERCMKNAAIRNRRNVDEERRKIEDLSKVYVIPLGAKEYDVKRL